jgi:RNA polymerase sigma-70 factor (ECF subfamily)
MTSAQPTPPDSAPPVVQRLVESRHEFLSFLERRLGDRALAEDILQEAFARSLTHAYQLESEESAVAWFYRILRTALTDYRRRQASASRKLDELARQLDEPSEPEVKAAVCQCVKGLAATLKPEYAAVLQAVEVEGMAVKDFADSAGISKSNAAVRVFRAREALKQQLERCCGSCADDNCRDCTCHSPAPARPA